MTDFAAVCYLCEELAAESSRNRQTSVAAAFLRRIESAEELEFTVRLLLGRPLRKGDSQPLNVSFATLFKVVESLSGATEASFSAEFDKFGDVGEAVRTITAGAHRHRQCTLTKQPLSIHAVKEGIEALADATGSGSRSKKERIIEALFSRATPLEAKYLTKNLLGEMRHGFSEGLMEAALSKAFQVDPSTVRAMHMTISDLGSVARTMLEHPEQTVGPSVIKLFNPYRPMLASPVQSVNEVLKVHRGQTSFEFKLDGVRVQVHKKNDVVKIFSRRLSDITSSLPEVVDTVKRGVVAEEMVLEGEVLPVSPQGRPLPFQHVMRRIGRVKQAFQMAAKLPLKLMLFDAVHCNGKSLLDAPLVQRREMLGQHVRGVELTPTLTTCRTDEAELFYQKALSEGHEGLVAKKPDSKYEPGVRGKHWLKIKPAETLDLTIVAAQYGTGYRHAWLSDYYLGARDYKSDEFQVVGKTFKGLTDAEIQEITKQLLADSVGKKGRTVIVIPRFVVEVAFSEIQKSPNYPSGYALRFARILRIRYDKQPSESDTIERVAQLCRRQMHGRGGPTAWSTRAFP